jgi:hypothetical protein
MLRSLASIVLLALLAFAPAGAVVGEAALTLTQNSTGVARRGTSDAVGNFLFNGIDGGEYTLRIEKSGFKAQVRKGIILSTGDRISLGHIPLDLGAVSETVSVTSGPGPQCDGSRFAGPRSLYGQLPDFARRVDQFLRARKPQHDE